MLIWKCIPSFLFMNFGLWSMTKTCTHIHIYQMCCYLWLGTNEFSHTENMLGYWFSSNSIQYANCSYLRVYLTGWNDYIFGEKKVNGSFLWDKADLTIYNEYIAIGIFFTFPWKLLPNLKLYIKKRKYITLVNMSSRKGVTLNLPQASADLGHCCIYAIPISSSISHSLTRFMILTVLIWRWVRCQIHLMS